MKALYAIILFCWYGSLPLHGIGKWDRSTYKNVIIIFFPLFVLVLMTIDKQITPHLATKMVFRIIFKTLCVYSPNKRSISQDCDKNTNTSFEYVCVA